MKTSAHTVALSPALRRLLVELQTLCRADCCKERAFGISAAAVDRWLAGERINRTRELAEEVGRVGRDLPEVEERVTLTVRGLESNWDVAEFQAFWEQFAAAFASAIVARGVADAEPGSAADRGHISASRES
jgi:hypothetical protein